MGLFDNDRAAPEATEGFADGIYFDMSEADYHALPRLSASGIKNMLISVPTFWAKSWMNTDNAEDEGEDENTAKKANEDDTLARILGRAYHAAIFEPATLDDRYVGEPDLSGYKNLLKTDTEVMAVLKDLGQTQKKAGETAIQRAFRLMDIDDRYNFKSIIMGEFAEEAGSRQIIARKYWDQIHKDIARIAANPEIHSLVTGGFSEVTILWTCQDSGVPMKARIDKLKADCFVDLKSFANAMGKPVNQMIADQVQYNKYYLSMRNYQEAISMIGRLDLKIMDAEPIDAQISMIEALKRHSAPLPAWLFFQEKNGIPNLLARRLKLQSYPAGVEVQGIGADKNSFREFDSALCRKADLEIRRAKQLFNQAMEVYGPDQEWFPFDMIGEIGDEDFRDYFLDSVPV